MQFFTFVIALVVACVAATQDKAASGENFVAKVTTVYGRNTTFSPSSTLHPYKFA